MKGFDRINVKSAVKSLKRFDLSQTHLTTANFAQPIPLYIKRLIPRDQFNVLGQFFTRMAPLVKPTYGRFSLRTMSVFVPAFQLCDDADAFFMSQSTSKGNATSLRYITVLELVRYFVKISTPITIASGQTPDTDGYVYDLNNNRVNHFDWVYVDANGNNVFAQFKNASIYKSRYPLTVLRSLGYEVPTGVDLQTSSTWYNTFGQKKLNALRILAFMKAFTDWMAQSTRYNNIPSVAFLNDIRHNITLANIYNASTHTITADCLEQFFTDLRICYESDYFTSAWQRPNAPYEYAGGSNDMVRQFVAPSSSTVGDDTIVNNTSDSVYNANIVTAAQLKWIEAIAAYVRRNNYSGSREVEKLLSRFGIKSEDFKSNYAHLLDTDVMPVNVGDVTAQAQTNDTDPSKTVELGDYAGKGIISGRNEFNFKCKDYGYLIVIGWYTVNPMYSYGFDRDVFSVLPSDFYQPEFDGIGVDAISLGEVQTNPLSFPSAPNLNDDAVFGFTERYNADRFGRDLITGDFYDLHADGEMNVWHTGRNLNTLRAHGNLVAQNPAFNSMAFDNEEYNRIFAVTDNSVDHFYLSAQFFVKSIRPMENLNQVPQLGEGDVSVARNGSEVN